MNSNNVLTTYEELEKREYDTYISPMKEGIYELKLDYRGWFKNGQALICYFTDLKNDVRIRLFAWRKYTNNSYLYTPRMTSINFSEIKDETIWMCTVKKNGKGKLEWIKAEKV